MDNPGNLLVIEDLHTRVGKRALLRGVNLVIPEGETHVLFGPNGSGKSSLVAAIMGAPGHDVAGGRILFDGTDIASLPTHERARLGIGVALQRPPSVKGVRLATLLSTISGHDDDRVKEEAERLRLSDHLERDVNLGFSGGETKRAELLQLLAQKPRLALLDEPESGVDLENMALVGKVMSDLLERHIRPLSARRVSGLIITHTGYALDYVSAEIGHVLIEGKITCSGNPGEVLRTIREQGFEPCLKCFEAEVKRARR